MLETTYGPDGAVTEIDEGVNSRAHVRPPNALLRCLGAFMFVWALSFALYPLQLTALAGVVWVVATLVLVPLGATITDRIVACLLLAAAPAVLIAWGTPLVPWLVSPPVLTGLLGSLVALAWGLGWTRPAATRLPDLVSIALGAVAATSFWLPFVGAGLARTVGILAAGADASNHYLMWIRVWANHGYLLVDSLPDLDSWNSRVYPQGSQALLADFATVLTGNSNPPATVDRSVGLFAILVCLQVGALALVVAWSVDRLSRIGSTKANQRRIMIFQVLAVLLVVVGPGSAISVLSLSFTVGLAVVIPALVLAATAQRSPKFSGLLVGASLIAAAASYPVCALVAVVLWPLYLWTSRQFWLASKRRRWYGATWTVVLALACAPMFVLLALRNLSHNWETTGYFQVLTIGVYVGTAILLALLIVYAPGRLPKPIEYAAWVAAAVSIILVAEGILQWLTADKPSYYTIKTMYLGWVLAVVAVAAGLAIMRRRPGLSTAPLRSPLVQRISVAAAGVLVIGALLVSVPLANVDRTDPNRGWLQIFSKEAWVISDLTAWQKVGEVAVTTSKYGAKHDGVTIIIPCLSGVNQVPSAWGFALNGSMNQSELEVQTATCMGTKQRALGSLPAYLQDHPDVTVYALATDRSIYDHALEVKELFNLPNLNVEPLPGLK